MMAKSLKRQEQPTLAETIEALRQGDETHVASKVYYGLSGLNERDIEELQPTWDSLSPEFRRKLMRRLVDIGEANVEMDYRSIGMHALEDSDASIREAAIELLFEDMSVGVMDKMIEMAQWDDSPPVRAAATSALGRFILAGELDEMPERETSRAQDTAASLWSNDDEDLDVRRRALESIANCSHEMVEDAINEAYHSDIPRLRASAVFAMGRTADERWSPTVVRELQSPDPELRFEAARAAGEIESREAVPTLVRLAFDADREIKEMAIWSLGEIGGRDSMRALDKLAREAEEAGDTDLLDAIEDALLNANLVDSFDSRFDDLDD